MDHWSRMEYPNVNTATMDVRFWIEVPDEYHRQTLNNQISGETIIDSKSEPRQQRRLLSAEQVLMNQGLRAPGWALRYDVYVDGYVQKYKIPERGRSVMSGMRPMNSWRSGWCRIGGVEMLRVW